MDSGPPLWLYGNTDTQLESYVTTHLIASRTADNCKHGRRGEYYAGKPTYFHRIRRGGQTPQDYLPCTPRRFLSAHFATFQGHNPPTEKMERHKGQQVSPTRTRTHLICGLDRRFRTQLTQALGTNHLMLPVRSKLILKRFWSRMHKAR